VGRSSGDGLCEVEWVSRSGTHVSSGKLLYNVLQNMVISECLNL
jgi:hypothetical protein